AFLKINGLRTSAYTRASFQRGNGDTGLAQPACHVLLADCAPPRVTNDGTKGREGSGVRCRERIDQRERHVPSDGITKAGFCFADEASDAPAARDELSEARRCRLCRSSPFRGPKQPDPERQRDPGLEVAPTSATDANTTRPPGACQLHADAEPVRRFARTREPQGNPIERGRSRSGERGPS